MRGTIYLLLAGFFLGISAIWVKLAGSAVSPFVLSILRVFIAAVFSLVLIAYMRKIKILWTEEKYMKYLTLAAIFGVTVGFGFFVLALQYVPVANVVLLTGISPIATSFLAYFFLKEKITKWEIVGLILVTMGIMTIYGPEISLQSSMIGNMFALLAGIGYSVFVIAMRYFEQKKFPFYTVTFWPMVFGGLFMFLFIPFEDVAFTFTFDIVVFVVMLGLSTFLAFTFYAEGLKTIKAHNAPIIILLAEPIAAIILAWLVLGEIPSSYIYIGGFLIILANLIVEKEVRKKRLGEKPSKLYKKAHPLLKESKK